MVQSLPAYSIFLWSAYAVANRPMSTPPMTMAASLYDIASPMPTAPPSSVPSRRCQLTFGGGEKGVRIRGDQVGGGVRV
eukprot:358531-Chlamydomonas_euryale.AAC.6